MQISKRTMLLLGALVVLAVGSNLDAAGLRPDRGKGGGTRGKGGPKKKDFRQSAQKAVKNLTAKIKTDFAQSMGGQKILKAVGSGNDTAFTNALPNSIIFANAQKNPNFNTIQAEANAIDAEITKSKNEIKDPQTSDNELIAIEKSANPGGALYKQYEKFFNDLKTASLPDRKEKTATELQKDYKDQLEKAVPAAYNFSTPTNLGGNKLNVPASGQSWFIVKDTSTTKLSGTVGTALTSVQDAQTAYKEALDLINAINKVDAAGVMQKADNSVITDTDITDEIARAKKAVADAQTAVNGAFEAIGGGGTTSIDITIVASVDLNDIDKVTDASIGKINAGNYVACIKKIKVNGQQLFTNDFSTYNITKDDLKDPVGADLPTKNKKAVIATKLSTIINKGFELAEDAGDDDFKDACGTVDGLITDRNN